LTTSKAQIVLKEVHEGMVGGHFVANIIAKKNQNKGFGQVGNNISRGTFYEVGFQYYRSNQTNM
jgi:hypothetical protein